MSKILVVDDEEPFRRLLKNELARKGYGVEAAAVAAKAVACGAYREVGTSDHAPVIAEM